MKKLGTVTCLLMLVSVGARHPHLNPTAAAPNPALTAALARASEARQKGQYSVALRRFEEGYRAAQQAHEVGFEASFLWGMANCHFSQRNYQVALKEYLALRNSYQTLGDFGRLSAVNGNLSSLYSELGELGPAIESARLALAQNRPPDPYGRRARLLILLGGLLARDGKKAEARRYFTEGIEEAARFDDPELLSNAWDRLGSELLLWKDSARAEEALLEAFRIRKLNHLSSLAGSYRKLGLLRLEQGEFYSATALLDASITESKSAAVRIPEWLFYHARGKLRLIEGNLDRARSDFNMALELARDYRLRAPSADSTRVSLESNLQQVYASFVETSAALSFKKRDVRLAEEAFEALEENRAGSLDERLRERRQLRRNMPAAYWNSLGELQSAETNLLLNNDEEARREMRRLRSVILEMESQAGGAGFHARADLLPRIQKKLGPDRALLSFQLGGQASWLWAATSSGLSLYRLPDRSSIVSRVARFREAIFKNDSSMERLGRELYQTLFGSLGTEYERRSQWLLSLDEGLFELPFAALAAGNTYLIEKHSLRVVSGAANWLDSVKANTSQGRFIGIGDPVYNTADSRWKGSGSGAQTGWLRSAISWPWRVSAAPRTTLGLSRLPGSGQEIESCALEWGKGSVLLKGREVTRQNVRRATEAQPAVVHFATHVLEDPDRSTNALIALSLSGDGHDELLGPPEIGGWNADAGLVVLSGCSSGAAVALPGAGLMGLTRAWLMAGAGAVVATGWTTPDDVGVFFRSFYRAFRDASSYDPAAALRGAQIEMVRSGGWRSQPRFWAAYFTMGNY